MSWYDDNEDRLLRRVMNPNPKYLEKKQMESLIEHTFINRAGEEVVIEKMSDRYLENIISCIRRGGDKYGKLHYFLEEKMRRQKYNIKIEE